MAGDLYSADAIHHHAILDVLAGIYVSSKAI